MAEQITWEQQGPFEVATILNGWAATIWDYGSHPDRPPHPDGKPFNWAIRPAITFDPYDREGYAATLDDAKRDADENLRELAVKPAEQDEELAALITDWMREQR